MPDLFTQHKDTVGIKQIWKGPAKWFLNVLASLVYTVHYITALSFTHQVTEFQNSEAIVLSCQWLNGLEILVRLWFDNPKTNPIKTFDPTTYLFSMFMPRGSDSQVLGLHGLPNEEPYEEVFTEAGTWQHKHHKQHLMASNGLKGLLYFIGDFNHYPSHLLSVGWRGTWKRGAH